MHSAADLSMPARSIESILAIAAGRADRLHASAALVQMKRPRFGVFATHRLVGVFDAGTEH